MKTTKVIRKSDGKEFKAIYNPRSYTAIVAFVDHQFYNQQKFDKEYEFKKK
jgi:hypothetical protein